MPNFNTLLTVNVRILVRLFTDFIKINCLLTISVNNIFSRFVFCLYNYKFVQLKLIDVYALKDCDSINESFQVITIKQKKIFVCKAKETHCNSTFCLHHVSSQGQAEVFCKFIHFIDNIAVRLLTKFSIVVKTIC